MAHDHDHSHDDHSHSGLDVQVERTGPCLATVKFTVSPEEFQRSRHAGLKNIAQRTRMKGFRSGKVPPALIEKHYGQEVDRDLTEHFLRHAVQQAVEKGEFSLAVSPRINVEDIKVSHDESWGHEFELVLRPEIKLGEVEGLEVEERSLEVQDEDIEAALTDIGRQLSRPEPAGEEGLGEDGMAVCKVTFHGTDVTEDREPLLQRDGIRLHPGAPLRGIDEELFKTSMTGAKEGEEREFPIEFPEDFPVEDARGTTGTCKLELTEVFKIIPPTEEELFKQFEVDSDEALRGEIRERMNQGRRQEEDQRIEQLLLEKILETHPMEIPGVLIEDQAEAKVAEMRPRLEAEGIQGEDLEARLAEEHESAMEGTDRALRAIYLMEEIAKAKQLLVTEQDFLEEFEHIAARNSVEIDEVRKYYQEESLQRQLGMELLERKVRRFLRESANIKTAEPSA